MNLFFIH